MAFCLMFIISINLFICFPSLSFSFKLCIQLCDDVCARGVQVRNLYRNGDLFHNYSLKWEENVIRVDCYNLYQKKKKIKSIIIQKKMEFSQETQVLVKIENCLIVSLSYNYNTIIILLL
jgi:hypothetical protein